MSMEKIATDLIQKTLGDYVVGENPNRVSRKIRHIILHNPLRWYFIDIVKGPLVKAIVALAHKYPVPTKENADNRIAHTLIDTFDYFHSHNLIWPDMMEAVGRVLIDEVEHDPVYRDFFQILLEKVIEAMLDGKWESRPYGKPGARYWKEEPPYGGETTIIYKLIEHRDEIKSILGIESQEG